MTKQHFDKTFDTFLPFIFKITTNKDQQNNSKCWSSEHPRSLTFLNFFLFLHQSRSIDDDLLYIFTLFIFIVYYMSPGCPHSLLIPPLKSREAATGLTQASFPLPRTKKIRYWSVQVMGTFEGQIYKVRTTETFKLWHRQVKKMEASHNLYFSILLINTLFSIAIIFDQGPT